MTFALFGRREAALADYRTTLLLAMRHRYDELAAFALNNIGLICEQLEDFRRALHFIEQAWALVQSSPGGALQLLNLGVLLSRVGEGSRAIPVLEKVSRWPSRAATGSRS